MSVTPTTELMYLKGVGPHRAEILAKRGLRTFEDLLGYLPFRYEDRIRFAKIREIAPGHVYTIRAQVLSGSLVRYTRTRGGMYHLLVRDETGSLPCKFFHSPYLEKKFKPGQGLVLHGKAELDAMRPGRIEMINPEYELLGEGDADSTEVGRIVPIYEAIGGISSRAMRRIVYLALEKFSGALRGHPVRPFSAADGIRGGAEFVSFAGPPAADLRGIFLLPVERGDAEEVGPAAGGDCISRARAGDP
jgi:ATP-dependent DNA helicase RecG